MLSLEMDVPFGHECKAMVMSLSGGLDIVLIDLVDDEQEQSVFVDEYKIVEACKYLLNHDLQGLSIENCLWYTAEVFEGKYKLKEFSIQIKRKILSSEVDVHFYRWRDENAQAFEKLVQHLSLFE